MRDKCHFKPNDRPCKYKNQVKFTFMSTRPREELFALSVVRKRGTLEEICTDISCPNP